MEKLIKNAESAIADVKYLKDEYENKTLWATRDGNVDFYTLLGWLTENKYEVEHMIKVGEALKSLNTVKG